MIWELTNRSAQVSNGDIVILAVQGDGSQMLETGSIQTLAGLGLSPELEYAESRAFVAIKGIASSAQQLRATRSQSTNNLGVHLRAALGCEFEPPFGGITTDHDLLLRANLYPFSSARPAPANAHDGNTGSFL